MHSISLAHHLRFLIPALLLTVAFGIFVSPWTVVPVLAVLLVLALVLIVLIVLRRTR